MKCKAALCLSVLVFAALVVTACSNAGQKQEEIPNPMVRYDTIDQIEKKVGYSPAILPAYSGFELKEMYQQLTYSPETYNGITYNMAENAEGKDLIAYFTKGDMTYSMSATGLDKDTFKSEFAAVIDTVNNQ